MDAHHVDRGPAQRPQPSDAVFRMLADRYGIRHTGEIRDLGGSSTLNLLVSDDERQYVVRVYRPWLTPGRLAAMQDARRHLATAGIPCTLPISTRDGASWATMGDRLVEVETYVDANGKMDTLERLEAGLPLLGRTHSRLRSLKSTVEGRRAPAANSIAPEALVPGVRQGTRRLRGWDLAPAERDLADVADELARRVSRAERAIPEFTRQLVHGDYWDNNVLLRDEEIVLVADLDFMGERARIDDLALTLYYTNSTFADDQLSDARLGQLRTLVDAYAGGLDHPLTVHERRAIPLAIARTALGFIAMIAETDSEAVGRK
ncbi:MAG: phosphotransferase, partial [Chloroflexota bacterium]|nr:phosphotransferase [Chloroflexota bacterium]